MPTKIRLQRHGKKKSAFYHIVIADGRAPRDGKFIEKIGTYNPNTNPASIDLDFDRALNWLQNGAQPTDTARAILSYEGVLFMNHLNIGVKKGAMTQDQANSKFETWKKEKLAKIDGKSQEIAKSIAEENKKKLAAEAEVSKKREQEILAKSSPLADEVPAEEESVASEEAEAAAPAQVETEETEAPAEEAEAPAEKSTEANAEESAVAEAPAQEAAAPAVEEKPAEEEKEAAPAAEEKPAEEEKEAAPAAEEKPAEEAPAAEANSAENSEEEKKEE